MILQTKVAQLQKALRCNRAVSEFVTAQLELLAAIADRDVRLGDHDYSVYRRLQGGDQQAVIASRVGLRNGARGESADAVCHEPFSAKGFRCLCDD